MKRRMGYRVEEGGTNLARRLSHCELTLQEKPASGILLAMLREPGCESLLRRRLEATSSATSNQDRGA